MLRTPSLPIESCLPYREKSPLEQHADLIRDYCREFFVFKGMIADFAIHDKETMDRLEQYVFNA